MDTYAHDWEEFLSQHSWHYFTTFTFKEEYSANGARRAFERWIRLPEQKFLRRVFMGTERGDKYGRIHMHCLLQYQPGLATSAEPIFKYWRDKYGRCRVEVPREGEAVSKYVSKYASKKMVDYDYWEYK